MNTNPKADFYFTRAKTWQAELERLRTLLHDCPLIEELKWGVFPVTRFRTATSF